MTRRRATGALEDETLRYLWAIAAPATPAQVHDVVAPELAYTTVMTVLSRLFKKGLVTRERSGRAFAYAATRAEADHRAVRMHSELDDAVDAAAVLSSFVDTLDEDQAEHLREILRDLDS